MRDAQNFHHNNAGQPQLKIQTSSTKIKAQAVASSAPMLQIFKYLYLFTYDSICKHKKFSWRCRSQRISFQKPSSALTPWRINDAPLSRSEYNVSKIISLYSVLAYLNNKTERKNTDPCYHVLSGRREKRS